MRSSWVFAVLSVAGVSAHSAAQTPPGTAPVPPAATESAAPAPQAGEAAAAEPRTPYDAYEQGQYDRALQGFLDEEVDRPDDSRVQMNIGSAYYRMRDFDSASRAFDRALAEGESAEARAKALYNLGNTAYRQGKLPEAIDYYMASLDLDGDDEDAKFNLEFVREELKRRREQNEQQQQQQQNQQQNQDQQQDQQDRQQQQDQQQQSGEGEPQEQQGEQGEQEQDQQSAADQAGADQDGDGLPDETERSGANPTDPQDPDSDDDGLPDGQEDRNRNGQLDPGETDPNRADTDGDGTPDGQEAGAPPPQGEGQGQVADGEIPPELTPEQAARFLDALEEERPARRDDRTGRRVRSGKDW